ncbi:MAG: GLPGLI family protein [Lutibacter sp.]|nr:GLPGLI family protein [Lutibacter sp.]
MTKITLFFIIISNYVYSQNSIEIEYAFNDNASIYNSKLILTDSISLFTIYDTKIKEKENDVVNTEKGISIRISKPKSQNRTLLQSNYDSLIYYNMNLGKKFYTITELKPKFEWVLEERSKTILNFKCNSAKMKFRNKEYVAYYTTEIPFNGGPWKYNGLPGLILELKSLDNKINFRALSIKRIKQTDKKDFFIKKNELVEMGLFKKLSIKNIKKRKRFIEFLAAENGGSVETNFRNNHIDFTITEFEKNEN